MTDWTKQTAPLAGVGQGHDGSIGAAGGDGSGDLLRVTRSGQPAPAIDWKTLIAQRHSDFIENHVRWQWLMDSYEGGDRYRNATYGPDRKGLPARNLFRHRREYPDPQEFPTIYQGYAAAGVVSMNAQTADVGIGPFPGQLGAAPSSVAQDDDYELRRARTPVPEFMGEAIGIHLSKVFEQEVERDGPPDLLEWWTDVDGRGTPVDDWVRETLAPLLLQLGCIDVCLDHPRLPPGVQVNTRADEKELGLDRCVASYILPTNVLWWRTDNAGRYTQVLVREYTDPSDRNDVAADGRPIDTSATNQAGATWRTNYIRYRYWTAAESILISYDGDKVLERIPHNFGRVPIVRLIDLKRHRTPNVGKCRYEVVAELQREYYNRDSELILSDTLQAHPLLSGPEDFCKADNTLSIGPGYVLPKKKNPEGHHYEGWEYVSPPKDPAQSLRQNKQDLIDAKDRAACLTKPAGVAQGSGAGGGGGTTAQSGVSKTLDASTGHKLLTSIAKSLARAERFVSEYALLVLRGQVPTPADRAALDIVYPSKFDLASAAEISDGLAKLQSTVSSAGNLPQTEGLTLQAMIRQLLPGHDDEKYQQLDDEVQNLMDRKAGAKQQAMEGISDRAEAFEGAGSAESDAGVDPSGQAGGTLVGNVIPAIQS